MTEQLTPEQNQRIAEWAGFEKKPCSCSVWYCFGYTWECAHTTYHVLPDLGFDLNSHTKWTIPKLIEKGYSVEVLIEQDGVEVELISHARTAIGHSGYNLALALSHAILQVIEKEASNETRD